MKKILLFLSIISAMALSGCNKEPIPFEGSTWLNVGDFGGFIYSEYYLTFTTDNEVTLKIGSRDQPVKTINGTYTQTKRGELELQGLEWEEDQISVAYLNATFSEKNNLLWIHVRRGTGTFSISFDPVE